MYRLFLQVLTIIAFVLPSAAVGGEAAPTCAGEALSQTRLKTVAKDGTLIFADGRKARLAGLRLIEDDRTRTAILALSGRRPLELRGFAPQTDRYGRLRVQAAAGGVWLQQSLLRQGLARVEIAPDRYECAEEMLAAEAEARRTRAGLWSLPVYAIRTPDNAAGGIGAFQIVEGVVRAAARKNGRVYLNFGADWRTDFTVTLAPEDAKVFRRRRFDPLRLLGSRIRARGIVQSYHGPEIELAAPENLEVLTE